MTGEELKQAFHKKKGGLNKIQQAAHSDIEGFCAKFERKASTDEVYTPPMVYEAVVNYVDKYVTPLAGRRIVRPFWPNMEFLEFSYQANDIVIDNPPFNMVSSVILPFFLEKKIDFFLFCDGRTPKIGRDGIAYHFIKPAIKYPIDNLKKGVTAAILTAFCTNINANDTACVLAGDLSKKIHEIQNKGAIIRKKTAENIFGGAKLSNMTTGGQFEIKRNEIKINKQATLGWALECDAELTNKLYIYAEKNK